MGQSLLPVQALVWLYHEQLRNKILALLGNCIELSVIEVKISFHDLNVYFLLTGALKGQVARN